MEFIFVLLLLAYELSPIPLLIIAISQRSKSKRLESEKYYENQRHRATEEQYRQYVCQLQNRVRQLDPNAELGRLYPQPPPSAQNSQVQSTPTVARPAPQFSSFSQPQAVPMGAPQSSVPPRPQSVPQTAPQTMSPAPAINQPVPYNNSVPVPSAPSYMPNPAYAQPVPSYPVAQDTDKDAKSTLLILVIGVTLLLLASIGFVSATWSTLSSGVRVIALLSFSMIFLITGIFAKLKLNLPNTSISFFSIGGFALPITIFGASGLGLLGSSFLLELPSVYNTCLLGFSCLTLLMVFGTVLFRSRFFAASSLTSLSALILTIGLKIGSFYSLNVLVLVLFASAVVLLAPLAEKIPDASWFVPYKQTIPVYAIINLYCMTVISLCMSKVSIFSGIFILLLAAIFLIASILRRESGMLSMPSMLLILIGVGQIINLDSMLTVAIWAVAVGLTFLALSFLPNMKEDLRRAFLIGGIGFEIFSTAFSTKYMFQAENWAFVILTIIPICVLMYYTIWQKHLHLVLGAILPMYTLLFGIALRVAFLTDLGGVYTAYNFRDDFLSGFAKQHVALISLIVAAVMYFAYTFLPLKKIYTEIGSLYLFGIMSHSMGSYIYRLPKFNLPVVSILIGCFVALCLVQANRTDRLHVKEDPSSEDASSISMIFAKISLCIYAAIWPIFFVMFQSEHIYVNLGAILVFSLFCFFYALCQDGRSLVQPSFTATISQTISRWIAFATMIILTIVSLDTGLEINRSQPGSFAIVHLLPLLIPLFCVGSLILDRLRSRKSMDSSSSLQLLYTLLALFSFSASLPWALKMIDVPETSAFFVRAPFGLTVMILIISLVFLAMRLVAKEPFDVFQTTTSTPIRFGLIIWSFFITAFLYFETIIAQVSRFQHPSIYIMLFVILGIYIYLLQNCHLACNTTLATLASILLCSTLYNWFELPVCVLALLIQVPVVVYCVPLLTDRTSNLIQKPWFFSAFASQCVAFLALPFLTADASDELEEIAYSVGEHAHSSGVFDDIFDSMPLSFTTSRFLFLALIGFVILEIVVMIRNKNTPTSRRSEGLLFVTLSILVWMKFYRLPSLSNLVEAAYLIPFTVFLLCMPWIFDKIKNSQPASPSKSDIKSVQFVFYCIEMGVLGLISLNVNDSFSLILFGIISFAILLLGYVRSMKNYLWLGAISLLALLSYIIKRILGSQSWWFFLFITGTVLIAIAVRNEIRKRNRK